jgi:hypothetical protein
MDAVAVMLTRPDLRQIHVPDVVGAFLDPDSVGFLSGVGVVEQAQLHRRGILGKQREVHSLAIPGGAKRVGMPGPDSHTGPVSQDKKIEALSIATSAKQISYSGNSRETQGALARIIHECRREASETEARRGFSQSGLRTVCPSAAN